MQYYLLNNKYFKYKKKYIELKSIFDKYGGAIEKATAEEITTKCDKTCVLCGKGYDDYEPYPDEEKFILNCGCCVHILCFLEYVHSSLNILARFSEKGGLLCSNSQYGCSDPSKVTNPNDLVQLVASYPQLIPIYQQLNKISLDEDIQKFRYRVEQKTQPVAPSALEDLDSFAAGTGKSCPGCNQLGTHWQGHACHNIKCKCKVEYCYICNTTKSDNIAAGRYDTECICSYRDPNSIYFPHNMANSHSFCGKIITEENIGYDKSMPYDKRCGCFFCNECQIDKPCSECQGTCPVCLGIVKQGPKETYIPAMGNWFLGKTKYIFSNLNAEDIARELGIINKARTLKLNFHNCIFGNETYELFNDFTILNSLTIYDSNIKIDSLLSSLPNKTTLKELNLQNIIHSARIIGSELLSGFTSLETLIINNCNITSIERNSFRDLTNLKELHINNNKLSEVPKTILNCTKLETLYLEHNSISRLNNDRTRNSRNKLFPDSLLRLSLVNNQIDSIDDDAFYNLPSLITLSLNQNKITNINNKFTNLPNIKKINLDNNKIDIIIPNTFPEGIAKIILSQNIIKKIDTNVFANLIDVVHINLNNNKISLISNNAFNNCRKLEVILLKNNKKLVNLTINMFVGLPNLRFINIDNPDRFKNIPLPNNASFS